MIMRILWFILMLLCFQIVEAQSSKYNPTEGYVSAGIQGGISNFIGDVYADLSLTQWYAGGSISRKISPRMHIRLGLAWIRLAGDDNAATVNSAVYARNLNFRNDVKELSLMAVYELRKSAGAYQDRQNFSPYLFTGLALLYQSPEAKIRGQWVDLQSMGTEGQGKPGYKQPYSKFQAAIPVGVGVRFKISDKMDFSIETSLRISFTDYLDDVGGKYPSFEDISNVTGQQLSNRSLESTGGRTGNSRDVNALATKFGLSNYTAANGLIYNTLSGFEKGQNRGTGLPDMYWVTGFQLSYLIDVGLKCPDFK